MRLLIIIAVFLSLTWIAVVAQTDRDANRPGLRTPATQQVNPSTQSVTKKKRIREGTPFKAKRAIFRQVGNRVSLFSEDETERFLCLENLNLERIMQVVQENPTQQIWSIDGMFTECQGENYVFIQRAVLAPSEPQKPSSPKSNQETQTGKKQNTAN